MRLPGGVHLGYCTNVHAADTARDVMASLAGVAARVRSLLALDTLGVGLYLSRRAAAEVDPPALRDFLAAHGLYVFTLNGFPYGDFHGERVKEAVYTPDWTDPRRAEHTLRLAAILDALAPDDVAVPTISTVPLGWRPGWDADRTTAAARALVAVADALHARVEQGGRPVRICLEPEPGCAVETCAEAARFFDGPLTHAAGRAADRVRAHLGLCWDTCHQAVVFEEPAAILGTLAAAGVAIGKVQLSSALELRDPRDGDALDRLAAFDEPRYLHQVRTVGGGADDLPEAFASLPRDHPWRVHFHVPIDRDVAGALGTTRPELARAIDALREARATVQYEVETYTWSVLPEAERPREDAALAAGLAREIAWARERLA